MSYQIDQLRPHIERELVSAQCAETEGDHSRAFTHLERAHVLGQSNTLLHIQIHWKMFLWGWRNKNLGECFGQVVRIIGATTKTIFGLIPTGNTGGSNVSPFRSMPIPQDLMEILESARKT